MFDYRRVALLVAVLLVPGGILLLPVLIADWRRRIARRQKTEAPVSHTLPPLAA